MLDLSDQMANQQKLQRALAALQDAHPELDTLAALVLLALRESPPAEKGISSALLARHLNIEHALIRRACAELEDAGWVSTQPASGASPALRVALIKWLLS
ncbi:MarR family transcriptional regulator [Vreelandella zhanjiangensis]|uniref:MarR family transcriptional regulator n=1 Tax=Vreelandella zhanjiangensis TaxID=1121960 RepID=UPI00402AB8F9